MRGPSLRNSKWQLWSGIACNSSPDPIPNLPIRCFFFHSSNLPAELTEMGTRCPIKDTFKPNMSSVLFCQRRLRGVENAVCFRPSVSCFHSTSDNLWDLRSQLLRRCVSGWRVVVQRSIITCSWEASGLVEGTRARTRLSGLCSRFTQSWSNTLPAVFGYLRSSLFLPGIDGTISRLTPPNSQLFTSMGQDAVWYWIVGSD